MKNNKNNIFRSYQTLAVLCLTIVLCFTACNNKDEDEQGNPVRTFRPTRFAQTHTMNPNSVKFVWDPISKVTYQLQVSRDSLEFVTELTTFNLDGIKTFELKDHMLSQTRYSARIKAINKNPEIPESGWAQITWKTQ